MKKLFMNRYGIDRLSIFIAVMSVGFLFSRLLWPISVMLLGYAAYRAFSKNFAKRQIELRKFQQTMYRISVFFDKMFRPIVAKMQHMKYVRTQKKQFKYTKCIYCKKEIRLPKDKGKIKVTCPGCKNQFIIKT